MKPGDTVKIINNPKLEHLGIGIILEYVEGWHKLRNVFFSGDGKQHKIFIENLQVIE
jgi:hypothetical protein